MAYQETILVNGLQILEEEVAYKALFYKYVLNKWYLYVIFLALFLGLTYFYTDTLQPEYEISSKLLIREGEDNYGPQEDWLKKSIIFSAVSENVNNEMQTLTSFWLMNTVVNELELDIKYYWKHKFSIIEGYRDFPIKVDSFSLKPQVKTSFEITPIDQKTFRFSQDNEIGVYHFGRLFSNNYGSFRIQKNGILPISSDSTIHVEFLNPEAVAANYLRILEVGLADNKNKSSILILTLTDAIPERGKDILNLLVKQYSQFKAKENTAITLKTLEFIDERLGNISSELKSIESGVEYFKLNNNIASETTSDLNIILQNVDGLVKEQKDFELQISILNSMKMDLMDTVEDYELLPVNLTLVNSQIHDLIKPYNDQVLERNRLLETGLPSNPVVITAEQKLNSLRTSIYGAIENMLSDLEFKKRSNENQYDTSIRRLRSVPSKERALLDKLRKQSITEKLYTYLLQKKEETSLALVSQYSNSLLIDPPHSSLDPVAPNKMKFYFVGIAGGLGIPFLFLIILDFFKDSIKTEKELKKIISDQTVIGVIGLHKGKNKQLLLGKSGSLVAERFRSLRTNIQFHHRDKTKCILVTSSTCDEGKTFVATNLATSFSLIKKKTIIIDFDLRKPGTIEISEKNTEIGLSDYLLDELEVDDIIQVSKAAPNLHYIVSGPVLFNSAELLSNRKVDDLFYYLKANYDIIIVDTPPIGLIADAILLNKHITESLFVVRSGFTKKIMLEDAKEIFDQQKLVKPSLILNGVRKGDYGYDYGSVYGRGYKKYGYVYN